MFDNAKAVTLKHQRLWMLPQKALYWQKRKILFLADLHIGKAGHFRKHGIAVPGEVSTSNLKKLDNILDITSAEHLVVLGDLFHSNMNREWKQFVEWRKQYRELEVSLVVGNHDILDSENYHTSVINVFRKMRLDPFLLVHDLNQLNGNRNERNGHYILSGHIHPAVQLRGQARQAMKLPCFYFGDDYGILPAFGGFTGTHVIEPTDEDRVYLIVDSQILPARKLKT